MSLEFAPRVAATANGVSRPHMKAAPSLIGISGNVRRPSRTRALVEAAARHVERRTGVSAEIVDLIDAGPGLGSAFARADLSAEAKAVLDKIEAADALIVASPVYKGSYTGLFKHLFDLIDAGALANKPILIGATGGGQRHALMVEHQFRPLFGFFGALTAPLAIYASDEDFEDGVLVNPHVADRLALAADQFAALLPARGVVPALGLAGAA